MILGSNLLLPILKNDRWIKNSHITTLYNNAPIVGLLGKLLILIFILVFYHYNNYGIIINSLIFLLCIVELSVWLYVSHNLTKLICVKHRGSIFDNWWYEITYRGIGTIICLIIILIGIYSWIHQKLFYFREFEIAIVFSIIYGIFWFTCYRIFNKRYKMIDEWIDQYLFGSLSKYEVYVYLYEFSQGNDVVDIIYKEHKKLKSMVTTIKEREGKVEEYRNIIANGNLCYDDIAKYFSFIQKELVICKESIDIVIQVKNKISKTQEFLKYSSSLELYSKLFERVSKDTDYIFDPISIRGLIAEDEYYSDYEDGKVTVVLSLISPYKFARRIYKTLTGKNEISVEKAINGVYNETAIEVPNGIINGETTPFYKEDGDKLDVCLFNLIKGINKV
jgi:hypothetical protein